VVISGTPESHRSAPARSRWRHSVSWTAAESRRSITVLRRRPDTGPAEHPHPTAPRHHRLRTHRTTPSPRWRTQPP
jgi:hypothetical protein